jgi:periplasmic protein TonB
MFEDALVESAHRIKTRSKSWSVVAAFINGAALAACVVWPLLHPQALPTQVMASLLVAPAPPPQPAPQPVVKMQTRPQSLASEVQSPSRITRTMTVSTDASDLRPTVDSMLVAQTISDGGNSLDKLLGQIGSGSAAVHSAPPARRPIVSSHVMAGNLIAKTTPLYPVIAREARVQGTVVLQATIGTAGEIENLRVISGPPLLQQAAMDAVRTWRYKPFYLNGEPVAVETTVNVIFNLGN